MVLLTNPVVPGQQIQWRITVTNSGPSRARNVVVSDTLPSGVTGASMTADTGGANCPISNGTATCPAVEIPVGGSLSWTLTGTLSPDATTSPTNTATVTGGPDPATPTRTAVASPTATPSPQANLTVSKALLTSPVVPGQQVQWQVTVTNNGPSRARNVVVSDTVPNGVSGASMKADTGGTNCPISNGTATCPAVEIPVGGSLTWTLTGTLDANATTTPTNTATVTGGPDPATPTHTAVASPTNSPTPQANLTVSKALLTNPVVPGQQVQWQVTVTNNGPSRARNVVVTDAVPSGVTGASMKADTDSTNCPITNGTATCPAVEIPVGSSLTWTLTGTLSPNATTTPSNTATVTGGPDPATPTHTAVASPTASPSGQASLTVSKALLTDPVVPGGPIQWRVSVTNNGPSQARNVVVTDQVPAGVTAASMKADADGANCPITSGTATCPAVQIPVGGSVSWTLTGTLSPDATTTPTNTATVTGGPDPATPTHTAVASPTATSSPQANLTVSKALVTNPVVPGQQIQWQVSVTNNGPSEARNVIVTDQVPTGVTNASMTATDGTTCPIANGTATCPAVQIPVGQTLRWTLAGTLASDATTTPTNTAIVTGGPDPATPTHTAVATPTNSPSPQASLTLSKVLVTGSVVPGGPIQWRVTVTNNGRSRARNVVVTDTVPAGVLDPTMAADADDTPCPITGDQAICPAIELAVGQSESYTLTGTFDPNATTMPTNTTTATGGPDPATPTHTAVATPSGSPAPRADLSIAKVLLTSPVVPGGPIQWRVTVTNNGPSRARNVVVTDTVPAEVHNPAVTADADGTPCPIAGNSATCPAIEIPADGTASYTVTGTLDAAATNTPVNVASVSGGPDPNPSNNTATATPTETAQPQANLTVTKILLTDPVVPGQPISWRVAVTNRGPSTARNVVVSDRIPDQVVGAMMTVDATGSSCPVSTGTATCPAVKIPVGATSTFTLTGMLAQDATAVPGNTATVTGGPDPATPTHTAVASPSGAVTPQANLTLGKVLVTNPVVPGQQIQWRVTVTNNGPSRARNVVVTDRIPAGVSSPTMTSETDGAACPVSGGVATCPAIELEVGQSHSYSLSGVLDPNATVTPTNGATGSPSPQANLTASKILLTDPVVPGGPIRWRVTVTNHGPSRARNVVVTDRIPDGVDNPAMADDTNGASCAIAAGVATCPAVEIPAGGTASWTLTGTLDPAATSTPVNTAVVTGGPDPATPTHTAVASPTGPPSQQARLTVSKVLLTSPVVAGGPISWRVGVTNDGPSRARNVVVTDRFPQQVDHPVLTADADGTHCPDTGGVATCPAIDLAVGATATYTLSGTLSPDATEVPVNSAVVTGGPDPATPTHTAVATPAEPITVRHDLHLAKQVSPAKPDPGDKVTYTITATNRASGTYHGAAVVDDFTGVLDAAGYDGDAHATIGRISYSPPRLTWTLDLRPGATETLVYTFTVKSDAGGKRLDNRVVSLGDGSNCPASTNRSLRSAREVPEPSATTGGPCATSITVNPSQPSPSPTGGPLPPTGSDPMPLAGLAAFAMLAAGGLLLTLRRSRR
ncbi:hypothetical protein ACFV6D_33805 [Kitasatospora sp. NPDC059812]|uniref:DUF7927 domain-containing protein n=1 Tax=Kitasatospora sp. NPDC059812 TaxID=3346958 RepID=UPI00364E7DCB